ncbi:MULTISPECIES: extracellular solute-binding protein [Paenibacillus]|jgi:raffinose/stachyose/melibiose transport system substrate-binding protein|uniref:Extracellular solute-binding protein family 1 n=2 Tax=Paenibacillus lactis TaxID=228574 RepID=G4HHN2_9BACL|nr:extracellular solute-binding protein [Paenibacillus lactis]EHB63608.1 extracellular solute-binding protein family 1 [Paenibacillus lactis 154]MBP1891891.1 raffinose/stachyose/melibiose transport system substrate-binding protein [Paenibacillus lactis]MCM3494353.1 extracellular solute-binding protein [Paenibacillus lactis]HAF99335.1 ABC transporter substrate-binding protein [Paenibacillus lactis]
MRPGRKIGLVLLAMSLLLAACGGGKSSEKAGESTNGSEKVKLTIWHNFAGDDLRAKAVRSYIDQFAQDHPEVTLDAQAIPPDGYRQRLSTVAAANEMPDVFFVYAGSQSSELHQAKLLQPITEVLDAHPEWKEKFLPGAFDPFEFEEGQIYSAPLGMSATSILYYNKALFEKHNVKVPTTWDEMMTAIKTFNDNGITPIALGNKAPWVAQSTILGSLADRVTGTEWFKNAAAQQGAKFTDPEFIEALGYFKQLVDNKAFQEGANSIDNTQAEQYFIQGNAAMMISGAWTLTNLAASSTEEQMKDIEVTTLPAIPGGKGEANTISGGAGGGLALSSRTEGKAKELALELIYTVSGPEAQKSIAESNSMVMYDAEIDQSKVTSLYYKAYNLVKSTGITPVYDAYLSAEAAEVINNGLQEIMMGGSVEDVAKKLQDAQARSATP